MRDPAAWYQMTAILAERLPTLRPSQQRGLATWLYGTLAGGSASQTAVLVEWLADEAEEAAIRQRLREFLWEGAEKAAPCTTAVDVPACFAPLLRWVVDGWTAPCLPLAIDATNLRDEVAVLAVSVLYRGTAIPVAWHVVRTTPKAPGQRRASWTDALLRLLHRLAPAVPPRLAVLVLVDRGLRSPRLRRAIRAFGWQPLMRLESGAWVRPIAERQFVTARQLAPTPGTAWVGRAQVYKGPQTRVVGTVIVVWDTDQRDVWVLLTDLPPDRVGVVWYALRMWIELGFRALKSLGWQWQRSRRTHPARVARHWLVLAVATLWAVAAGSDAEAAKPLATPTGRRYSLIARGRACLRRWLVAGALPTQLCFRPEPWPDPRPHLLIARPDFPPAEVRPYH